MATAATVFARARAALNDTASLLYGDTQLLPYLQMAYDELQGKLVENGVATLKEISTIIPVAANATTITSPSDLVEVIEVWERPSGSTDDFKPVDEREWEPEEDPNQAIIYWTWREEQIQILQPTTDREVKLRYKKSFSPIVSEASILASASYVNVLGFRTAALAAKFIGENPTRATELNGDAQRELDTILNTAAKKSQGLAVRRRRTRYRRD